MPSTRRIVWLALAFLAATAGTAEAHPWHRHRDGAEVTRGADGAVTAPAGPPARIADVSVPAEDPPAASPFLFTAAPRKTAAPPPDIAAAFAPFEKLKAIACRRDDRWFYVESQGIPDHPLMVGIRAWQQQVPLPQPYVGDNAWQIPLHPVRAAQPASTKDRFLRGAIAVAVNGIPIFNPLNNRGEDASAIGELDEYGGHCGRADDYHYHVAPVHLEKTVGKGRPIAYALDGYPIYGLTEPDGAPVKGLDECGGHEDAAGNYHYHALPKYPHLIAGFRGEVVEREGQVDPQPRARGVREALPPLQGATIVGFTSPRPGTNRLTYEVSGRKGTVDYTVAADGSAAFTFTDPSGRVSEETYTPRGRGPGGGGGGGRGRPPRPNAGPPRPGEAPPRPGDGPPREDGRPTPPASPRQPQPGRPAAGAGTAVATAPLAVTSPAFAAGGRLPVDFTCDGAGVSPPIEWQPGPRGTKSYAVVLWHEAPDRVKCYWIVSGIPATVTKLPRNSRTVGTLGLNDKQRPEYDPMCSKGPGVKEYHLTVYALSAPPQLDPSRATRETLLAAIDKTVLASGTLTFTTERQGD